MRLPLCAIALLFAYPVEASDFSGWYTGLEASATTSPETLRGLDWGGNEPFRFNSPAVGAFVGYNYVSGSTLFGWEVRAHGDTEKVVTAKFLNPHNELHYGKATFVEVFAPSVNARIGKIFGPALFYARGGVGFSYQKTASDTIMIDPEQGYRLNYSDSDVVATFNAGAGVETNFDRYFVRGEAEVRAMNAKEYDFTKPQYRATLGVGIRF